MYYYLYCRPEIEIFMNKEIYTNINMNIDECYESVLIIPNNTEKCNFNLRYKILQ